MTALPKSAQAILALPGVESLHREEGDWCCHLAHGWTTDALGGGGTIIDSNLKTIRAHVVGAHQIADCEAEPVAPVAPVASVASVAPGPELLIPSADLPVFSVLFWSVSGHAWRPTTYPTRSRRAAVRLRAAMAADRPGILYRVAMV